MTRSVMAAAAMGILLGGSVQAGLTQGATTADGVYTSDQAATGKALFDEVCATCHQPAKFTGAEFTRAYVGKPLSEMAATMAEMPQDNPGSLTAAEFATLIAYFLDLNTYPAGATPLDGETSALRRIMVSPRP